LASKLHIFPHISPLCSTIFC